MKRTAVILSGRVLNVVAGDADPAAFPPGCTFVDVTTLAVSPGDLYNGNAFSPAPSARPRHLTKRAFQSRFPASGVGVATKYDLLTLFLSDDSYAAAQVPDANVRLVLRANIITARNRLDASAYVDLDRADAANFTGMLLDPGIPAAFRLTLAERTAILSAAIADDERP